MKKRIILICFFIVFVISIIGILLLKSITLDKSMSKDNNNEQIVNNEKNQNSIVNNSNLDSIIDNKEQDNSSKQGNIKEGVIVATNGFEFDEEDLKEKIGIYLVYENFMQDYFVPEQENENANIVDYANEAKVLIGYELAYYNSFDDPNLDNYTPTEEEVRKAIEEFCGEHYEKYVDTAEYWIAFDGDNAYEFVEAGDYNPTGHCNYIESIEEHDGKYTVTFVYSRPSESDYLDNNLDNIQKYRKQFTFVYHEDAKYTKYQLTELSFIKGEKI